MPVSIKRSEKIMIYYQKHGVEKTKKKFNLKETTINRYIRKWKQKELPRRILDLDIEHYEPKNDEVDLWEIMKKRSRNYIEKFEHRNILNATMQQKKYIAICFVGDQHLGHIGVDYELAEEHAKAIGHTNNAYAILGGDGIDNFITSTIMSAVINQMTSPKEQIYLLHKYLSFFNGHILAMISGNHDIRTKKVSGLDFLTTLAKQHKLLYSPNEFKIKIILNGIEYKIYIRHKYRYNSSLNLTHTVKRLLKEGDYEFDIGSIYHHHQYDMESFLYHNEEKIAIRTGSYKVADPFSREVGFNSSTPLMPMVILSPFKKEMVMFKDLEQGLDFLKYKNDNLKRGKN